MPSISTNTAALLRCVRSPNTRLYKTRKFPTGGISTSGNSLSVIADKSSDSNGQSYSPKENTIVLFDSLSLTYKSLDIDEQMCGHKSDLLDASSYGKRKGLVWYTCGPTVYESAHLGHARCYVTIDIIQRLITRHFESFDRSSTQPPIFVMNITDVDDKILSRAKELNVHPLDLARNFESEFMENLKALNVRSPSVVTRVSEHVESDIIPYIEKILENGMAYVIPKSGVDEDESGIYFDVASFEKTKRYGKLAPPAASRDEETFFSWNNNSFDVTQSNGNKRDRRDFALWKFKKKGEELFWESQWGDGRPGWHIECSAMIEAVMKKLRSSHTLQIHAGGVDLKFPHHTNEIAQAEAYHHGPYNSPRKEWIPHWVHIGHLNIKGLKMSKSLKNFITIQDLLRSNDDSQCIFSSPSDDFRLWCLGLSGSYRRSATYSEKSLMEARSIRYKIVQFIVDTDGWLKRQQNSQNGGWREANSKKWRDADYKFINSVTAIYQSCKESLMGTVDSNNSSNGFDLDGMNFLNNLMDLLDVSNAHLQTNTRNPLDRHHNFKFPLEPIELMLAVLRDLLLLVGFSHKTVYPTGSTYIGNNIGSKIRRGEDALIDSIVKIRGKIRSLALRAVCEKDVDYSECMKDILNICDVMRDTELPSFGIEIFDDKLSESDLSDSKACWRWGIPEDQIFEKSSNEVKEKSSTSREKLPIEKMFCHGEYSGKFLEFDENGFPTKMKDGTVVSKTMLKKLSKKRERALKKQK